MPDTNIEIARRVVANSQHETHNGFVLDTYTASVMVQVFDLLGKRNQNRFNDEFSLEKAASISLKAAAKVAK